MYTFYTYKIYSYYNIFNCTNTQGDLFESKHLFSGKILEIWLQVDLTYRL